MSEILIRPIALADIEQFQQVTDAVMRERKYLAFIEGFAIDEVALFVARNIRLRNPQMVADDDGRIVGWCDIRRETIPVYSHTGHLGMGLLALIMAAGRWLELRFADAHLELESKTAGIAATVAMLLIGLILVFYREPL